MKNGLWRVTAVVALAGMTVPVGSAEADPSRPEVHVTGDFEIAVFLCTPATYRCHKRYATAKQLRDVEAYLKKTPEVTEVRFVSRAAAYANFRREFADHEKVRAEDLPESFRVRVSRVADRARITALANRPAAVGYVVDQAETHGDPATGPDLTVFLCTKDSAISSCLRGRRRANKVTAAEKRAVVAAVERIPGLVTYRYEDQATAYRGFAEAFKENEALVKATKVADMPESYLLWLRPGADWESPRRRLAGLPGVSAVTARRCWVRETRMFAEYGLVKTGC
ncbi:permease-like cell division protein FtsX [Nonomuraea maritima]|uniref:permease-like cell division protein FtsX n=1 Tax=Nonomuraea maritima TaxID=683260 RepID=UPI00371497BD